MPPAAPVRMMRLPDRFMLRFLLVQLFDGCLVKLPDALALQAAVRGRLPVLRQERSLCGQPAFHPRIVRQHMVRLRDSLVHGVDGSGCVAARHDYRHVARRRPPAPPPPPPSISPPPANLPCACASGLPTLPMRRALSVLSATTEAHS